MPKGHRAVRSQGYYRASPVATPTTQYPPISSRTNISVPYYTTPLTSSMSQQSYSHSQSGYPNGGPVQHPLATQQQYTQISHQPQTQSQQVSIRPSSGAWTPSDDQTLMAARAQGMNWAPIQQAYFPTKTPNACRKRHERLMERRSADDWDGLKLENLAKNYMEMRKEIWAGLAAQTGEKWNVVEQKCISIGLKNLQTAARSHARRERMSDPSHHQNSSNHLSSSSYTGAFDPTHTDDSGYADGSDVDVDLQEYDDASDRSSNGYQAQHSQHSHHHQQQSQHQGQGYHSHSHSQGSAGSGMSGMGNLGMGNGMGMGNSMGGAGMGMGMMGGDPRFLQHGDRLPSMDMGIDAIINRPNGGR